MKKKKSNKSKGKKLDKDIKEIERDIKKQTKKENRQLRNILICLGVFILIFMLIILFINSLSHFEYREIKFDVVKEGDIIFYKTSIPVIYQGEEIPYNIYLRKDPRKLDVPVDNEINFKENMVINMTGDFNCNGDGIIAIANLVKLSGLMDIKVIKDPNASCDSEGRYMFVQIQEGNETSIEQFGPACYNLNVNNCEILEVTEQLMLEIFVRFNEINN